MNRYPIVGLAAVVLLSFALTANGGGSKLPASAKAVVDQATQVILYSLEPSEKEGKGDTLRGWKVLGKTALEDVKSRTKLLAEFAKAIAAPHEGGAKCFEPRHALRAVHDGKSAELIICFECRWVSVYVDGKFIEQIEISDMAQPFFDQVLRAAKVPLSKIRK